MCIIILLTLFFIRTNRDGNPSLARGTQLDPTVMGRILPSPIKNRDGYGFKTKNPKWVQVWSGFWKKTRTET